MDLTRQSDSEKLNLCRKYFYAGFAFLPFVWIVNVIWFMPHVLSKRVFPEQKDMKRYVLGSAIGASIWVLVLAAWQIVFQMQRVSWGAVGDHLSFTVPLGRP